MEVVEIINDFKEGKLDAKTARLKLAEACHPSKLEVTPEVAKGIYIKACAMIDIGPFDFDYEED